MEKFGLIVFEACNIKMFFVRTNNSSYDVYDKFIQPVTIGADIAENGIVKPNTIQNCINIVKVYEQSARRNGIEKISLVSTGFLSSIKNLNSFMDQLYNNVGYALNILSVEDEFKALFVSTVNSIDSTRGVAFYISDTDLYILSYSRRNILQTEKYHIGSHTLVSKFGELKGEKLLNEIYSYTSNVLKDSQILAGNLEEESLFVGAGTQFVNIGKIARKVSKYPLDIDHNYVMSRPILESVYDFFKTIDISATSRIKGITEYGTDIIGCTLAVTKAIYDKYNIANMSISKNGINQGVIYNNIVIPTIEKPVSDIIVSSVDNIRSFYDFDMEDSDNVYNFALMLFKQLKVIHKLHRFYVKPLRVAALLYNCGRRIRLENNCKFSFETILNSNVYGLTQREILLAAYICMCQNLDNFNLSDWVKYKDIVLEDDLEAVRKLGVILRIASAFVKMKSNQIKDIECDILGDSVIMKTITDGDATFEIVEARKVSADFKKVFKKNLQII